MLRVLALQVVAAFLLTGCDRHLSADGETLPTDRKQMDALERQADGNWHALEDDLLSMWPWRSWRFLGARVELFNATVNDRDHNPMLVSTWVSGDQLRTKPIWYHVTVHGDELAQIKDYPADTIAVFVIGRVTSINIITKHVRIDSITSGISSAE